MTATTMNNCLLCYNGVGTENQVAYSRKLSKLCCKYLHSALTQEYLQCQSTGSQSQHLRLCSKCFESTLELSQLNDQMEFYQKRISELVLILSLEILHRRVKTTTCNDNDSGKKLMEVDISSLTNDFSWNISSPTSEEIPVSSTKLSQILRSEDVCDEEIGDPLLIPIPLLYNNENNIDIITEDIKCFTNNDIDVHAEGIDSCDTELCIDQEIKSMPPATAKVGNQLFPILKLQKLEFQDNDRKIISVLDSGRGDFMDLNGEHEKRPFQSVWSRCELRGSYRSTTNQESSFETCREEQNLESQHFSTVSTVGTNSDPSSSFDEHMDIPGRNEIFKIEVIEIEASSNFGKEKEESNINSCDEDEKPYRCDVCSRRFKWSHVLTTHIRIHTGERPFKCDFCGRGFAQKGKMLRHRNIHTGERVFKCDFCDKTFARKDGLLIHKMIHAGKRPYKCDLCDKSFRHQGVLVVHKRIHTRSRPFQCDLCDKTFTQQGSLLKHKMVHMGDRPYKCDSCDKRFIKQSLLLTHTMSHTGDKPFHCDQCEFATNLKSSLKSHKIRRHSVNSSISNFKCRECKKGFKSLAFLKLHYKKIHFALDFSDECVIKNS